MVLLRNKALDEHPAFRVLPTTQEQWDDFIDSLDAQEIGEVDDFTATLTGVTAVVTGTINYMVAGGTVVLTIPTEISGTSNTIALGFSGLPEKLWPELAQTVTVFGLIDDSGGGETLLGRCTVDTSGGAGFLLYVVDAGSHIIGGTFTNSGTKGIAAGTTIIYSKG